MIPKTIHKVFIQHDMTLDMNSQSEFIQEAHSTWKELNPGYNIVYYSGNDCRTFLNEHYGDDPDIIKTFDSLIPYTYKCDFFRYCMLYIHGGFYSDWKMVLHEPLDSWVPSNKKFVCSWDRNLYGNHLFLQNSFIGTIPKSPILKSAIDMIVKNVKQKYYGKGSLDPTGPGLLGKAFMIHYDYNQYDEVHETDLMIGKFIYQEKNILEFMGRKLITYKHPQTGQSQSWSSGNNYHALYIQRRIYK